MNTRDYVRGCPNTEMVSQASSFEEENPRLNFHKCFQAPHYSSKATRIAYYQWELSYPGMCTTVAPTFIN